MCGDGKDSVRQLGAMAEVDFRAFNWIIPYNIGHVTAED